MITELTMQCQKIILRFPIPYL